MTRPYRRIPPFEQTVYGAADWTTPWETAQALGARFNRDARVILIWAQNRGLAPRGRKRLVTPEDVQAIREGVEAGLLATTIARTLELHPETVRRVMHREGLSRGRERAHDWGADGPVPAHAVCQRCGMQRSWPGASSPCVKAGGGQ